MAIEVKSASLKGVIKWLIMMQGMSNESNNLKTAEYEVASHTHACIRLRVSHSVCVCAVLTFSCNLNALDIVLYSQSKNTLRAQIPQRWCYTICCILSSYTDCRQSDVWTEAVVEISLIP